MKKKVLILTGTKEKFLIRIFTILLFLNVSLVSLVAQEFTIDLRNSNVKKAIELLQQKYGYSFSFRVNEIDVNRPIDVNLSKSSLQTVLNKIFDANGINFEVKDKVIILTAKDKKDGSSVQTAKKMRAGIIIDEINQPVIGAAIIIKGTTIGTVTEPSGAFNLEAAGNDTLVVAYLGYNTVELPVSGLDRFEIKLTPTFQEVDEIVVTALGIKRSEKALSYNVQKVDAEELLTVKDVNFVNALSGKVAGVNINNSSSGAGGASKVVMRGTKSISQSNNALYVIDGVPMYNRTKSGGTEFDSQGSTEASADLNPEDIESISVLTGAAAAALYGSDAANGAIVITTKKGRVGKLAVSVSSNTEILTTFVSPKFQNRYGTGVVDSEVPVYNKSWGQRLNSYNFMGYDPVDDYLQTGVVSTENLSLSTGTEKNQTYLSAGAVHSKGIVPNNKYNRYNLTFRNTTSFLDDKMKLDVGASFINQYDRNMTNQGTYSNPLVTAYLFPRGDDWADVKMYERFNEQRGIMTQFWPQGFDELRGQNPYWINYRNLRENKRDRYMLNANLSYEITDWMSVAGRARIDQSVNTFTEKFFASTIMTLAEGSENGLYGITEGREKQAYADALVNINKTFSEISLQANIGTSITDNRYQELKNRGPIDSKVGLANFFDVVHLDKTASKYVRSGYHDQTQSVFASLELGYKSTYYLTATARNDWPSQLAGGRSVKSSFFYPSVGGSVVFSEMLDLPEQISYLKLRSSYASVGLPFPRFLANATYPWENNDWANVTYQLLDLKPEKTNSFEVGLTMRFLSNFNLDVSYYNTRTFNQTFDPQLDVSTGASKIYIQTGNIANEGVELALGYDKKWRQFNWISNFTLSSNRNKIKELVSNYVIEETGEVINKDRLDVGGLGLAHFILKPGGTLGDLYSFSDLRRDSDGQIYVDEKGNLSVVDVADGIKLGSVLPKANLAWRNDLKYKNINFGFMVSARLGGIVYSATQAALDYYGVSEASADARDQGGVMVNGGDRIDAYTWYSAVGGQSTGIPQYYTYSATNVRLQEANIGYTIPRNKLGNVMDITLSLVGRNLWMIYNKAPFDPEAVAVTGNYYQGIDNFMMPSTRNIGFNVRLNF